MNLCCCTLQESFHVAKTAFRQFKMKVRSNLAITHTGPETLEEAVQDYINRNVDLYDAPGMVSVSWGGVGGCVRKFSCEQGEVLSLFWQNVCLVIQKLSQY